MLTLQSLPLSACPAAVMLPVESRGPRTRRRRKQPQPSVQTQHLTPGQRPALEAGVQGPKQLSGAWSVTGHACPDPGHTKVSPGGCVSALPVRQEQEKAGIASSTSCRHTQFLSAFVLIEKRTHREENPPLSVGMVPSGRTHRKRAILLCANKHTLV
ncbi:unnamed protein product [Pipistrellus nathusii]|uniref:Uncharacterized protein n=1 Tax=Pipistrellus nathusii TaxID=59473 RepID=A0ABP0A2W7_PIPNA